MVDTPIQTYENRVYSGENVLWDTPRAAHSQADLTLERNIETAIAKLDQAILSISNQKNDLLFGNDFFEQELMSLGLIVSDIDQQSTTLNNTPHTKPTLKSADEKLKDRFKDIEIFNSPDLSTLDWETLKHLPTHINIEGEGVENLQVAAEAYNQVIEKISLLLTKLQKTHQFLSIRDQALSKHREQLDEWIDSHGDNPLASKFKYMVKSSPSKGSADASIIQMSSIGEIILECPFANGVEDYRILQAKATEAVTEIDRGFQLETLEAYMRFSAYYEYANYIDEHYREGISDMERFQAKVALANALSIPKYVQIADPESQMVYQDHFELIMDRARVQIDELIQDDDFKDVIGEYVDDWICDLHISGVIVEQCFSKKGMTQNTQPQYFQSGEDKAHHGHLYSVFTVLDASIAQKIVDQSIFEWVGSISENLLEAQDWTAIKSFIKATGANLQSGEIYRKLTQSYLGPKSKVGAKHSLRNILESLRDDYPSELEEIKTVGNMPAEGVPALNEMISNHLVAQMFFDQSVESLEDVLLIAKQLGQASNVKADSSKASSVAKLLQDAMGQIQAGCENESEADKVRFVVSEDQKQLSHLQKYFLGGIYRYTEDQRNALELQKRHLVLAMTSSSKPQRAQKELQEVELKLSHLKNQCLQFAQSLCELYSQVYDSKLDGSIANILSEIEVGAESVKDNHLHQVCQALEPLLDKLDTISPALTAHLNQLVSKIKVQILLQNHGLRSDSFEDYLVVQNHASPLGKEAFDALLSQLQDWKKAAKVQKAIEAHVADEFQAIASDTDSGYQSGSTRSSQQDLQESQLQSQAIDQAVAALEKAGMLGLENDVSVMQFPAQVLVPNQYANRLFQSDDLQQMASLVVQTYHNVSQRLVSKFLSRNEKSAYLALEQYEHEMVALNGAAFTQVDDDISNYEKLVQQYHQGQENINGLRELYSEIQGLQDEFEAAEKTAQSMIRRIERLQNTIRNADLTLSDSAHKHLEVNLEKLMARLASHKMENQSMLLDYCERAQELGCLCNVSCMPDLIKIVFEKIQGIESLPNPDDAYQESVQRKERLVRNESSERSEISHRFAQKLMDLNWISDSTELSSVIANLKNSQRERVRAIHQQSLQYAFQLFGWKLSEKALKHLKSFQPAFIEWGAVEGV